MHELEGDRDSYFTAFVKPAPSAVGHAVTEGQVYQEVKWNSSESP
jgi:hypothetical protein